jgi:hypothetical protein
MKFGWIKEHGKRCPCWSKGNFFCASYDLMSSIDARFDLDGIFGRDIDGVCLRCIMECCMGESTGESSHDAEVLLSCREKFSSAVCSISCCPDCSCDDDITSRYRLMISCGIGECILYSISDVWIDEDIVDRFDFDCFSGVEFDRCMDAWFCDTF